MLNDLLPWAAVYRQAQCWVVAGCFEAMLDDLRAVPSLAAHQPPSINRLVGATIDRFMFLMITKGLSKIATWVGALDKLGPNGRRLPS